jgi:hypothetical protein
MKNFKKIKARIIANYIIKQIRKISKTDTCNEFLRVTENVKKSKYIYIKFNLMDGVKDIQMNFIEYYNLYRKLERNNFPRKSIFDYWKIYKKRLPSKFYKYLDLLSKRYKDREPEKARKLALMVINYISNSKYKLSNGLIVHNTLINTGINCYKITLKFL